ncbi:Multidrug export protein EmrA [Gemmata obscuriglobus]|nr:biotin/lipoyl-binding protein [Gemmata obscuriglobus]QEG26886.1 Multidrug export protein EmrA [Gemmata obscuriglobus]VTS02949.1 Multidrug resistance efflux pump OS=Singulisphaera acidiphila (strain ATCC BAA-1392 / DSM 18658 / VKM B-2454 / MOB10) GN=Sinac_2086 PE=4 SV=1: Biotin_lipoyl_2 [Gemmata obscuriglobus UQM 2246]
MNWLRKMRPVLIVIGLGLAVGSLVGARALTHGSGSEATAKGADVPPPRAAGGPVVLGTVDTDPPPVSYGLPPVIQSGTIAKVSVKDSDEVAAGQELYVFDSTIQQKDVDRAKAAVAYAETKVRQAEELAKQHKATIDFTRSSALANSERKVTAQQSYYNLVKENIITGYKKVDRLPESEWEAKLKTDPALYKAHVDYDAAVGERDVVKANLARLEAADPQVQVREAQAAVEQARAELAKAQAAVEMCVVRARTAGTVEQVSISAGATLGISTRTPALWLIPAGPRVVRAEVEAEFAHRVGPGLTGKPVTVMDHSDAKLTYTGTVRHIGSTFLLKRASAENFLGSDTRVIEAVIDIADPAPAGKPPLRVGQRVRVNMGQ